jgi:CTP synthase (UTP-ammonia lyase)
MVHFMDIKVALVGDYDPAVTAHRAIPEALQAVSRDSGYGVDGEWIPTDSIDPRAPAERLAGFDAIWCAPKSPYASVEGALGAIRYARTEQVPFLGTCAGFQHALIEFARDVLGMKDADHAETNPRVDQLVTPLTCSLVETVGRVRLAVGSRIAQAYGVEEAVDEYRCSYGLNPGYRQLLEDAGLRVTGVDYEGDVRSVEVPTHPFFVATLFQPERAALRRHTPPLVMAFAHVAAHPPTTSSPRSPALGHVVGSGGGPAHGARRR